MKQVERYFYPAVFTYEPGQEIAVDFPDLKCATSDINDDDALLSARELLGCVLYGLEEDAEEIPAPHSLGGCRHAAQRARCVGRCIYAIHPPSTHQPFCQPHCNIACMA